MGGETKAEATTKTMASASTVDGDKFRQIEGDEDNFFDDLPPMMTVGNGWERERDEQRDMARTSGQDTKKAPRDADADATTTPQQPAEAASTFQRYSFRQSTVVGADGKPVISTRRRYQDSSGRLKAMHERRMDGQTMRLEWRRENADDEGRCDTICSSDNPEAFEAAWRATPFGRLSSSMINEKKKAVRGGSE
ncbi:hypothetical protein PINS_up000692 [Pythium insidiosum]|nr:hypothetical protein PINS_up000692 [Pythium insidiosum]